MHVQTLIFPKAKYNRGKALKWAKEHGFQHYTSREEGDSIRVRQFPPSGVKRYGGTFIIGKDVKGVYAEVDKEKFKDMPFQRLRRRFKISKYGDDDKDKVFNYKDCRPWDKKRQDEYDDVYSEGFQLGKRYGTYWACPKCGYEVDSPSFETYIFDHLKYKHDLD